MRFVRHRGGEAARWGARWGERVGPLSEGQTGELSIEGLLPLSIRVAREV